MSQEKKICRAQLLVVFAALSFAASYAREALSARAETNIALLDACTCDTAFALDYLRDVIATARALSDSIDLPHACEVHCRVN